MIFINTYAYKYNLLKDTQNCTLSVFYGHSTSKRADGDDENVVIWQKETPSGIDFPSSLAVTWRAFRVEKRFR